VLVPQPIVQWTPPFIAAVAYNVLLASGLGWALWLLVVQRLPTQVASLTSLAIPLMGVLLAWLILHERPGAWEVAGMVLIAVALLSLRRTSAR
jgi:drug/metabolite transporter (DMT)-like permease